MFDYLSEVTGDGALEIYRIIDDVIRLKSENIVDGQRVFRFGDQNTNQISSILEALVWVFPERVNTLPIVVKNCLSHLDDDYRDDKANHIVVVSFLFEVSGWTHQFNLESYDVRLFDLLDAAFHEGYFKRGIVYDSGDLSNQITKFVTIAEIGSKKPHTSARWNSVIRTLTLAYNNFRVDPIIGDASLEYALINQLCFRMFATLSPLTKLKVIHSHFGSL